ncbi:MAG: hypothetical protein AAGJ83_05750, partial [Planctomycetota bacterium]
MELLEDRRLLSANDGFAALASLGQRLELTDPFSQKLPLVNRSTGESAGLSEFLTQLHQHVADADDFESDPSTVLESFETTGIDGLQFELTAAQIDDADRYEIEIDAHRDLLTSLDLGELGLSQGIAATSNEALPWSTGFDFRFVLDLTGGGFAIDEPQLFIQADLSQAPELVGGSAPALTFTDDIQFSVQAQTLQSDAPQQIDVSIRARETFNNLTLSDLVSDLNIAFPVGSELLPRLEADIVTQDGQDRLRIRPILQAVTSLQIFDADELGFGFSRDPVVPTDPIDVELRRGLENLSVRGGSAIVDADIEVDWINQLGDARLTLAELESFSRETSPQPLADLLRVTGRGTASSLLPVPSVVTSSTPAAVSLPLSQLFVGPPQLELRGLDQPVDHEISRVLSDGLDGLVQWAEQLDDSAVLSTPIPVINTSIGEQIDLGDFVRRRIAAPIQDLLAESPHLSANELFEAVKSQLIRDPENTGESNIIVDESTSGSASNADEIAFTFDLTSTSVLPFALDLGLDPEQFPIEFEASLEGQLATTLDLDLSFGVDRSKLPSVNDAFFLKINETSASLSLVDSGAQATGRLGFSSITASMAGNLVQPEGVNTLIDASISIASDPNKQRVTLSEIRDPNGRPVLGLLDEIDPDNHPLFSINPTGAIGFDVLVAAQIGDFNTGSVSESPRLTFSATELFEPGQEENRINVVNNLGEVLDLKNVSAVGFLGALQTITTYLEEVRQSPVFGAEIPLTGGTTVGQLVDLSSAFSDALLANAQVPATLTVPLLDDVSLDSVSQGRFFLVVDGQQVDVTVDLQLGTNEERAAVIESAINSQLPDNPVQVQFDETSQRFEFVTSSVGIGAILTGLAHPIDENEDAIDPFFDLEQVKETLGGASFATVQEFEEQVTKTTADTIDGVRLVEATADSPAALVLDIRLDHGFDVVNTDLDFDFGVGDFVGFEADSTLGLTANLAAELSIGVFLETPGTGFQLADTVALENPMRLEDLNDGDGVLLNREENASEQIGDGLDDLTIRLHDGTVVNVNLDGSETIADVIA